MMLFKVFIVGGSFVNIKAQTEEQLKQLLAMNQWVKTEDGMTIQSNNIIGFELSYHMPVIHD